MNEEKNRFGDFISLVERARKDAYFAQKDRELLAKQIHCAEESPQGQLEPHTRNCPQCAIALQRSRLMDVTVSRCSGCGGTWVERAVLQQFMKMKKIGPAATYAWSKHSLRYLWPDERRQARK